MNTSTLVYSTDNPPAFEEDTDTCCLGAQGVISTGQCNDLALRSTGTECPLCVL